MIIVDFESVHSMPLLHFGGGLKNSRKVFAWEVKSFGVGGLCCCGRRGNNFVGGGGAQRISKENFKLHNPSIKSIFRITSLIYFRCIRNTHYCFIKYTTLRFLVFYFFIFQVLQMLLHFQYCMSNILINIISNLI